MEHTFQRYLSAKKSVDDRALNRFVWEALAQRVSPQETCQVVEIGAGIGTMLERMLERGLLHSTAYTLVDSQAENILAARWRLSEWVRRNGFDLHLASENRLEAVRGSQKIVADLVTADVFDFVRQYEKGPHWDLLVAHAFLDLIDIPRALPLLYKLVRPGGLFYFTINFDALTLLEPSLDPELDESISAFYHHTMDERITAGLPSGDSRAGRHLFQIIRLSGAQILAAGASDWVVFAGEEGYPADEAYFLHFIIETIRGALENHPRLDPARFAAWVAGRHAQVEQNELVYIAHQLDFLGRWPG